MNTKKLFQIAHNIGYFIELQKLSQSSKNNYWLNKLFLLKKFTLNKFYAKLIDFIVKDF